MHNGTNSKHMAVTRDLYGLWTLHSGQTRPPVPKTEADGNQGAYYGKLNGKVLAIVDHRDRSRHPLAMRQTASKLKSISSSEVSQEDTLILMAVLPCHSVPLHQQVPSF
jgi:hypothetical protein